jgi:hypothetical protein
MINQSSGHISGCEWCRKMRMVLPMILAVSITALTCWLMLLDMIYVEAAAVTTAVCIIGQGLSAATMKK